MTCCLYEILFPNGKRYFGITNDFVQRIGDHRKAARNGPRLAVHTAMLKYPGAVARKIAVGQRDYILDLEEKIITRFGTTSRQNGYNIMPGGMGGKIPQESRDRAGEKLRGRKFSAETLEKMIASARARYERPGGKDHLDRVRKSPDTSSGKRLGASNRGCKQSAEWVARRVASAKVTKHQKKESP